MQFSQVLTIVKAIYWQCSTVLLHVKLGTDMSFLLNTACLFGKHYSVYFQIQNKWEDTPGHYIKLDIRTILQEDSITEVQYQTYAF